MGALSSRRNRKMFFMAEMQRYDGWYNNLAHPRWGSTGKLMIKMLNCGEGGSDSSAKAASLTAFLFFKCKTNR